MPTTEVLHDALFLLSRICLAAVFLVSGIHKARYYDLAVAEFRQADVAAIWLFLPATICLHLLAGVALVAGVQIRLAAASLAIFTIVATLKVHCFWRKEGADQVESSRNALANLAIVGGLLLLTLFPTFP